MTEEPRSKHPEPRSRTGPPAHEDLTIAETLETTRDAASFTPGSSCFILGNQQRHCVADEVLQQFVKQFGAFHPSDFLSVHGVEWESMLFDRT
jgi:hypothetical protein